MMIEWKLRLKADDGSDFSNWEKKTGFHPFIRNGFVGTVTDCFCSKNKGVEYVVGTNVHSRLIDN